MRGRASEPTKPSTHTHVARAAVVIAPCMKPSVPAGVQVAAHAPLRTAERLPTPPCGRRVATRRVSRLPSTAHRTTHRNSDRAVVAPAEAAQTRANSPRARAREGRAIVGGLRADEAAVAVVHARIARLALPGCGRPRVDPVGLGRINLHQSRECGGVLPLLGRSVGLVGWSCAETCAR
jgi:hypothetical protein